MILLLLLIAVASITAQKDKYADLKGWVSGGNVAPPSEVQAPPATAASDIAAASATVAAADSHAPRPLPKTPAAPTAPPRLDNFDFKSICLLCYVAVSLLIVAVQTSNAWQCIRRDKALAGLVRVVKLD